MLILCRKGFRAVRQAFPQACIIHCMDDILTVTSKEEELQSYMT